MKKGSKQSEESKEKMRQATLRNPSRYWLGKKHSQETKDKISKAVESNPTRFWKDKKRPGIGKNLAEYIKENGPWNKGMSGLQPWQNIEGLKHGGNKGTRATPETIEKIKAKRALQKNIPYGVNHHNWKGGITPLRNKIRSLMMYLNWRKDIFERDNHTCQLCGVRGGRLNADHFPKSFAFIFNEYQITTIDQAKQCLELWDITNGRTLCMSCHQKTDNYGSKACIKKPNLLD